jgi:hypothetical protein
MGSIPQPLHQNDAYGCFITLLIYSVHTQIITTSHGSARVDTKINQRNRENNGCQKHISKKFYEQTASHPGCKNPVRPSPVGCTQTL